MDLFTNVDLLVELLRSWGIVGVLASIMLNIVLSVTGVLPSIFLSGANAVVFGLFWGFVISLIGEVIGAGIAFILYRLGIAKWKKLNRLTHLSWIQRVNQSSRIKRMVALMLLRMNPIIPSGLVNFATSLTSISFADFMFGTIIGKTPSMVFETFVGHDLFYLAENKLRLLIALGLAVAVLFLFKHQLQDKSS